MISKILRYILSLCVVAAVTVVALNAGDYHSLLPEEWLHPFAQKAESTVQSEEVSEELPPVDSLALPESVQQPEVDSLSTEGAPNNN